MITGGRSTYSNVARRWEEKEVESTYFLFSYILDIQKARENLQEEIQKVTKSLRKLGQNDQASFNIAGLESRLRCLETEYVYNLFFYFEDNKPK